MTLELPSARDQEFFIEVSRDWEAAGLFPTLICSVGGADYSDRIPTGDVGQSGIAVDLVATLAGNLPLRLYGAPVELDVAVGGRRAPLMQGLVSLSEEDDGGASTSLPAASAGSLADKYPLNETVSYHDAPPYYIVRDALRRLPYPPGSVRVENVGGPHMTFARGHEEGPFEKVQHASDILSKVQEKIPSFSFRDTAWGGHEAKVSAGLARIPDVPDHMRFTSNELIFWKSPALTLEQYAKVIVFKDNPDGSPAFEPAVADVTYPGHDHPPPAGYILPIAFTGTDPEEAWRTAYLKAQELRQGLYRNEPILPFKPLMTTTDYFAVTEVKDEDGTFYEREWLHYVDAYRHPWNLEPGTGTSGFATRPTCRVTLADEQVVKAPTLILSLVTTGNVFTPREGS